MFIQGQTGNFDVICDNVPSDATGVVRRLPGLSQFLEAGRGSWAKKDVIALSGESVSEQVAVYGPRQNSTHTTATRFCHTSFATDPKISGTTVHPDGKITWRGASLNDGDITAFVGSVKGCQRKRSSTRREIRWIYVVASPRELAAARFANSAV